MDLIAGFIKAIQSDRMIVVGGNPKVPIPPANRLEIDGHPRHDRIAVFHFVDQGVHRAAGNILNIPVFLSPAGQWCWINRGIGIGIFNKWRTNKAAVWITI